MWRTRVVWSAMIVMALGWTDALAADSVCEPLLATSACAQFYPSNTSIKFDGSSFGCQTDVEQQVFGGGTQTVWALLQALSPGSTCYSAVAQLMCMSMYKPCTGTVASSVCRSAVGVTASCSADIQTALLPLLIPSFANTYGACELNPLFSETGTAGIRGDVELPTCQRITSTSVCADLVQYPIYTPFGRNQSYLESQVATVIPQLSILSASCSTALKRVICTQAYTKCDTYPLINAVNTLLASNTLPATVAGNLSAVVAALQIPFPRLSCNSLCRSATTACGAVINFVPGLAALLANGCSVDTPGTVLPPAVTCSGASVPGTGQPNYPLTRTTLGTVSIANQTVVLSSPCNAIDNSPCVALPTTSICAPFFPPGALVDVNPSFACMEDAESSLAAAPIIWDAVGMSVAGSNSTCQKDLAQLMCLTVFKPCNSFVSKAFCRSVVGSNSTSDDGSCPKSLRDGLLTSFLPTFSTALFNCDLNPVFKSGALGVGPQVAQTATSPPIPTPQCQPLSRTSVCRGVVDYPVFVPASFFGDQSRIESQIRLQLEAAFMLADTDSGCLTSVQKMLCSMAYTRCDTTVLATSLAAVGVTDIPPFPIAFPRLPCQTLCQRANRECQTLINALPALANLANCDGRGYILTPGVTCGGVLTGAGGFNFPINASLLASVSFRGQVIPIESSCNPFVNLYPTNASSVVQCKWPLVAMASPSDSQRVMGGSCSSPCPNFLFTKQEYSHSNKFFSALTIISVISSAILGLTFMIFPIKRKQLNTLNFSLSVFMLSLAMLIDVAASHMEPSTITCKNASEPYRQDDGGACVVQAVLFFYFSLTAVAFWLISALDLYLKVVLNLRIGPIMQRKLNISYFLFGWGVPFILLIIGLARKSFGGSTGTPWCFFALSTDTRADWALFYYPVLVSIFIGFFFMGSIMWRMIKSARLTGSAYKKGFWLTQLRPMIFIFVFLFLFTFIFAYRADIYFSQTSYRRSGEAWVACMLLSDGNEDECGKKPSEVPSVGLWFILQLVVGGQGVLNSIIFGSQKNNFTLWKGLILGKGIAYTGKESNNPERDSSADHSKSGPGSSNNRSGGALRPAKNPRQTTPAFPVAKAPRTSKPQGGGGSSVISGAGRPGGRSGEQSEMTSPAGPSASSGPPTTSPTHHPAMPPPDDFSQI